MSNGRVDLSVLQPFTPVEMQGYLAFLRKNGSEKVAEAVEAVLDPSIFMLKTDDRSMASKS